MSDLISRKEVKAIANKFSFTDKIQERQYKDFINHCLDIAPTVAHVRGEWIDTDFGVLCTNCRTVYDPFDIRTEEVEKFKFCPNCGARMVKDNE